MEDRPKVSILVLVEAVLQLVYDLHGVVISRVSILVLVEAVLQQQLQC